MIHASSESTSILLIDDDGTENFETYFEDALRLLNYDSFITWDINNRGTPPVDLLQYFSILIWETGKKSPTLTSKDREILTTYLNSGGNLFITGQDIGYDLEDMGEIQWMIDNLKAIYVNDDSENYSISGINGDPISDKLIFNINGGDGANNQDYPSIIAPTGGAHSILTYSTGDSAAVAYDGDYSLVYLAFGFEGIYSSNYRVTLMKRILDWFDGTLNVKIEKPASNIIIKEPRQLIVKAHGLEGIQAVNFRIGDDNWYDFTTNFNGSHYTTYLYPENFTNSYILQVRAVSRATNETTIAQIYVYSPITIIPYESEITIEEGQYFLLNWTIYLYENFQTIFFRIYQDDIQIRGDLYKDSTTIIWTATGISEGRYKFKIEFEVQIGEGESMYYSNSITVIVNPPSETSQPTNTSTINNSSTIDTTIINTSTIDTSSITSNINFSSNSNETAQSNSLFGFESFFLLSALFGTALFLLSRRKKKKDN